MKSKSLFSVMILTVLLGLTACDDDDNPTGTLQFVWDQEAPADCQAELVNIWIDNDLEGSFSTSSPADITLELGLYSYRIEAEDGAPIWEGDVEVVAGEVLTKSLSCETGLVVANWTQENCFRQSIKLWVDNRPRGQYPWGTDVFYELEPGAHVFTVKNPSGSFVWQQDTLTVIRNGVTPWPIDCKSE